MDLNDLRLFLAIAQCGSISAGARQSACTPAAASAALKRLEAALATRLFERSTRALRLTQAGQEFQGYCQNALAILDEAQALLRQEQASPSGLIRLTVPSDLAEGRLSTLFDTFQARHPGIRLQVESGDALAHLLQDDIDLAIRYGELADSRLVARLLWRGPQVLCAAPRYLERRGMPENPDALADHDCLCFQRAGGLHTYWRFLVGEQWREIHVSGPRSANNSALVRHWAVQGAGLIYKAALDLEADLAAGRLRAIEWPEVRPEPVSLYALFQSRAYLPLRVRLLLDFLQQGFASGFGVWDGKLDTVFEV